MLQTNDKPWYYKDVNELGEKVGKLKFKPDPLARYLVNEFKIIWAGKEYLQYIGGVYKHIESEDLGKLIKSQLYDNYTPAMIESVKYVIRETLSVNTYKINENSDIINLKNCMLKLYRSNIKVIPHDPDEFITIQINASYGTDDNCPTFLKFLQSSLYDDDIITLQEIFGYLIVQKTIAQKFFILLGEGGCGKSTIIKILTDLLGSDNVSNVSFQNIGDRFKTAQLYKKTANFCSDISSKNIDDTSIFKQITGEDKINAERKGQDPFDFYNKARLLFSCNELPKSINDRTDGFYRRFLILQFRDPLPEKDRDIYLYNKLKKELNGILNWALEGLIRLINNNYIFSISNLSIQTLEKYKAESNNTIIFAQECCVFGDDLCVSTEDFYNAYANFCKDNGYKPCSSHGFGSELERNFKVFKFKKRIKTYKTSNPVWVYTGISLNVYRESKYNYYDQCNDYGYMSKD